MTDKYLAVNQGKVWIASRNSAGVTSGFEWIGDADGVSITGSQNFLDFQESYSGNRARVIHLPTSTDLGFTMAIRNVNGKNLARAFYGSQAALAGTSVSSEAMNAYASSMVPLKYPNVSSVVVTKTAGSVVLVANTDYTLDAVNGTVTFLSGSTNVTGSSAVPCTVSYTYGAITSRMEALTDTIKDYVIRLEAKSQFDGLAQVVQLHRANMDLATDLALITQDVGVLNVGGALLPAPEITTSGLSQYFTYTQV